MYKIFLFILFIFITSCNHNLKTESKLKKCVEDNINISMNYAFGNEKTIKFYDIIKSTEIEIFGKKTINKKTYIAFISRLDKMSSSEKNKISNVITKSFEREGFIYPPSMNKIVFIDCPSKFVENNDYLKEQIKIINSLELSGYTKNVKLNIIEWINSFDDNDFTKTIYRAPLLLIVYRYCNF